MSRGPGVRERALLRGVEDGVVWAVPDHVNRSEAKSWRRAARSLVLRGKARGVYLRRQDRAGRWFRALAVTAPDSDVMSDVFCANTPAWVEVAPPFLTSFTRRIQALVLADLTGRPCSPEMVTRLTREARGQAA